VSSATGQSPQRQGDVLNYRGAPRKKTNRQIQVWIGIALWLIMAAALTVVLILMYLHRHDASYWL
jgi:hypothetical protein